MIQGHKASAYSVRYDGDGKKIEEEHRQCAHCQYTWVYVPGSGKQRGFCLKCMAVLCGKPECMRTCVPWDKKVGL